MLIDGKKVSFHTDLQNGNCEEMHHRRSFGFSAWFLSASSLTGSQWCNVLFDPYFFEARSRYFVFPWRHFSKFLMHSMVDLYSMEPFWYIFANPFLTWNGVDAICRVRIGDLHVNQELFHSRASRAREYGGSAARPLTNPARYAG